MERMHRIKLRTVIQERKVYNEHKPFKLLIALLFEVNGKDETIVSLEWLEDCLNTGDLPAIYAVLQRLRDLEEITTEPIAVVTDSGRLETHMVVKIHHCKTYVENE